MKILIIVAIIGLLAVIGLVAAGVMYEDADFLDKSVDSEYSAGCAGGCSATSSCGSDSCGIKTRGSCGCQK